MLTFLYLFIYRTLSGVQNGFGYARHSGGVAFSSILLIAGALWPLWLLPGQPLPWRIAAYVLAAVSVVSTLGVWDNFTGVLKHRMPDDIHFWELLLTGGITLCWIVLGGNLYLVAAHIYPALLLHKGAVNIGGGSPFWDTGTDDPTGKTFNVPLLNIRIRRMGLRGRQILAAISVIAVPIVIWQDYSLTLFDILNFLR